jgi:hypothetical protein
MKQLLYLSLFSFSLLSADSGKYVKPLAQIAAGTILSVPLTVKTITTGLRIYNDIRKSSMEPNVKFGGLPVRHCCKIHEATDRYYWHRGGHASPFSGYDSDAPIYLKPFLLNWVGNLNHFRNGMLFTVLNLSVTLAVCGKGIENFAKAWIER